MDETTKHNIATDLLEFCGNDLSVQASRDFFKVRDLDDLSKQDKSDIFILALTLLNN